MKTGWTLFVSGALMCLAAAWMASAGQEIIGFKVPEYTPEGRLKSEIHGSKAVIDENGNAVIDNLQLDIFPENGHNVQIVAPNCRFFQRQGIVESSGDVRIETPGMQITGTGFRWDLKAEQGVINSNVNLTIKNSEGLYRHEPSER